MLDRHLGPGYHSAERTGRAEPSSVEEEVHTVAENVTAVPPGNADSVAEKANGRAPGTQGERTASASTASGYQDDYADLKRLIVQRGLLDKQPAYYVSRVLLNLSLLGGSIAVLIFVESLWLQLLNAAFLAFAFTQLGFLGHDAGHRQIFNGAPRNDMAGLAIGLMLGLSRSWWVDTHNQHHVSPNDLDLDPHTAIPMFVFSEEQAAGKRGFTSRMVGYQSFYFFPLLLLEGIGARFASVQYLAREDAKYRAAEALFMVIHFALYAGLLLYVLSVPQAVLFIVVHQALLGLYMGYVFAPNHKGMPLLDGESKLDFLRRQVLTSRDVKAHPVTDFLYGGLNYQIEHHLFPNMPRNRLREAQPIVRDFCRERSIPYYETGVLQSNKEILRYLHQVSASLREARP